MNLPVLRAGIAAQGGHQRCAFEVEPEFLRHDGAEFLALQLRDGLARGFAEFERADGEAAAAAHFRQGSDDRW